MPIVLGVFLGVANVLVIAAMIAAMEGSGFDYRTFDLVFTYGIVPGLFAGATIGAIAGVIRRLPAWVRCLILIEAAIAVVAIVASWFGMQRFVPHAAIPTIIGCLILERFTRVTLEPPLPVAVVRS